MTVCIAAICKGPNGDCIVGASDRMLSTDSSTFEPATSKIWQLTSSIYALFAGATDLQIELLRSVSLEVNERVRASPERWLLVEEVADLYRRFHDALRAVHAERSILLPIGLTTQKFISGEHKLSSAIADEFLYSLQRFRLEGTQTIFAGVDTTGAHLVLWDGAELSFRDGSGFVAIGSGCSQAEASLMTDRQSRLRLFDETVVLVHSAKKRAETSLGVGRDTDMISIGPRLGENFYINNWAGGKVMTELDRQFDRRIASERRASEREIRAIRSFAQKIVSQRRSQSANERVPSEKSKQQA